MRYLIAAGVTVLVLLWVIWRREYHEPAYVDPGSEQARVQLQRSSARAKVLIAGVITLWVLSIFAPDLDRWALSIFLQYDRGAPSVVDDEPRNAEVLEQLRIADVDLTRPLELAFYLYFPTEQNAKAACDALMADGFVAKVEFDSGDWSCRGSKTMLATLEQIEAIGEKLDAIAAEHGGVYDGWGAALPDVE